MRLLILILLPLTLTAAITPDTAQLAAHLKPHQGKEWIPTAAYRTLQSEYLRWIDNRLHSAASIESMNNELKQAGLFLPDPEPAGFLRQGYAGYLSELAIRPPQPPAGILVVEAGIYRGARCGLDVTAVLYQIKPLKKLAHFNATPADSDLPYSLSGLDIGAKDANGERIVATGWSVTNCTSMWNGKGIRIDRLETNKVDNLLARALDAQSTGDEEDFAANVQRDIVTFRYYGATGEGIILSVPAIARYRVVGRQTVRQSPIAQTRIGFLFEWLHMTATEAARWSPPDALKFRKEILASYKNSSILEAKIAICRDAKQTWEIGLKSPTSPTLHVVRISGTRATELRIAGVASTLSQSCATDKSPDGPTLATELPW